MSDLEPRLEHALAGSGTVKLFESVRVAAVAAVRHSGCAAIVRQVSHNWRAMPRPERTFAIGLTLVTAGIVHILMNVASGSAAGSFWLIVPAAAVSVGVLGLILGRAEPRPR